MTTETKSHRTEQSELAPLISRTLGRLRRRIRRYVSVEGLALAVAWLGLAFWISLALDWLPVKFGYDEMDRSMRIAMLAGTGLILLGILFWLVVRRLSVTMPNRSMAVLLERRFNEYDDSLLTTVEMNDAPDHAASFNEDMLRRTCEQALEQTSGVKISHIFNPWPLARNLLLAVVFVVSVAVFAVARADAFNTWLSRFMLLSDVAWPRLNKVIVEGEFPVKIAKGDDFTVVVKAVTKVDGDLFELPDSARIEYLSDDGASRTENMTRIGGPRDGVQEYNYTFRGLLESVNFEVVGGDYRVRGEKYRIQVVESPSASLELVIVYPEYTEITTKTFPVRGTMEAPRGSRVTILVTANKPLKKMVVSVNYGESTTQPYSKEEFLEGSSSFSYTIDKLNEAQDIRFTLVDTDGIRTRQPILLSLTAIEDHPPEVEVHLPGIGASVTVNVRIPFEGIITDEYGVKHVLIKWTRPGQETILIPFKEDPNNRQEFTFSRERAAKLGIDVEELDFQFLAHNMRKLNSAEPKEAPPPNRKPGEKKGKEKDSSKKPAGEDESEKYQLKIGQTFTIKIIARDGCTLPRANNEGTSAEFSFKVVTDEELRAILAVRELIHRKRFEQIRDEFFISQDSLAAILFGAGKDPTPKKEGEDAPGGENKEGGETPRTITAEDQRLEAFLRVQRVQQNSDKNSVDVLEIAHLFDLIREELINNRIHDEELIKRLKSGVADPLQKIGDEMFKELDERLNDLIDKCDKDFSDVIAREASVRRALKQADKILEEMDAVLLKMLEYESFNDLIRLMQEIIKLHGSVIRKTKKMVLP